MDELRRWGQELHERAGSLRDELDSVEPDIDEMQALVDSIGRYHDIMNRNLPVEDDPPNPQRAVHDNEYPWWEDY